MTFYEGRRGARAYEDVHETPVLKPAAAVTPSPLADETDWSSHRRARPAEVLLPVTVARLRALPDEVKPRQLAGQFPRVANLVAMHWDDDVAFPAYLEALVTDQRGGRRGFPEVVRDELRTLRDYWFRTRFG